MSSNVQILEIAQTIAEATGLQNVDFTSISGETRLLDPPFNLDSIDILEAVACIENKYHVQIADAKAGAQHFKNLDSIVHFVNSKA